MTRKAHSTQRLLHRIKGSLTGDLTDYDGARFQASMSLANPRSMRTPSQFGRTYAHLDVTPVAPTQRPVRRAVGAVLGCLRRIGEYNAAQAR